MNQSGNGREGQQPEATPTQRGTKKRTTAWFCLSSNWSIGSLLSRGILLPSAWGEPSGVPYLDEIPDLRINQKGLPGEWCSGLRSSRRNAHPIAVRLAGRATAKKRKEWQAAITLDDVDALVFPSEKEKIAFTSQRFADYDLELLGIELQVDASVFGEPQGLYAEQSEADRAEVEAQEQYAQEGAAPASLRSEDSSAAIAALLLIEAPGRAPWLKAFETIWTNRERCNGEPSKWLSAISKGVRPTEDGALKIDSLDEALLISAARVLHANYPIASGWPASDVLEEIVGETRRICPGAILDQNDQLFRTWEERCRSIIKAQSPPTPLLDDKHVVLRSLLFLFLRGEIESILASENQGAGNSGIRVGSDVRTLAGCLAAARTGLRNCPSTLKAGVGVPVPSQWLRVLGRRIAERLGLRSHRGSASALRSLPIEYRSIKPLQGEWIFKFSGQEVSRKTRWVDPELIQVEALGEGLGYHFEEHGDDGLKTRFVWESGRAQTVYLTLKRQPGSGTPYMRFWSHAMDLSAGDGPAVRPWPTPKLNNTDKAFFIDLLQRNSEPGLNCRFAISEEERAVIVLVDQLIESFDKPEFIQHVEHVAQVADDFERERGEDRYR
jgi:hypothetical protein